MDAFYKTVENDVMRRRMLNVTYDDELYTTIKICTQCLFIDTKKRRITIRRY